MLFNKILLCQFIKTQCFTDFGDYSELTQESNFLLQLDFEEFVNDLLDSMHFQESKSLMKTLRSGLYNSKALESIDLE